jgi:hypothetical protein
MTMPPVNQAKLSQDADDPVDRLVISLRSYVTRAPKKEKPKKRKQAAPRHREWDATRTPPSDWVLVFDCETTTTPDQRLKFGTYQLRYQGRLMERGIFYERAALTGVEFDILKSAIAEEYPSEDGEEIYLRTRHEFVEQVFFGRGYKIGAQIVGFNLPFDISRLAVRHVDARDSMRGGFSFVLVDDENWPTVTVRHLSQRTSFIHFTGTKPGRYKPGTDNSDDEPDGDKAHSTDGGFFVDVKTLAAVFTSESHSLESLSKLLEVPNPKLETDRHGELIDQDYVRYAWRDAQTTWECFDALAKKFDELKLADTGLYELYSEASLGKAYLKAMGVKPWRDVQPDFSPRIIGQIMSTYYGGRSEVHIRREITPIIHFDFLSMYPTVCTLMNLWRFVISTGIETSDDTANIREFVSNCTAETLRTQSVWKNLNAIVQVLPQGDLFPVRAHYAGDTQATIGLNYLTSDEPLWFTLADVLVSKILTGKTPKIIEAIRFNPIAQQNDLNSISVAGKEIHPSENDFYRELIIHRLAITRKLDDSDKAEKPRLESDRLAIKILANATSYGIFVELNIKDYDRAQNMIAHGVWGKSAKVKSEKFEEPGRYFHPLLGTLITGAARFMLALAERQVIDQGLDWAFCDTDSLAVDNPENLPLEEFKEKALAVQDWFVALNPYGESKSILQLEKVNYPRDAGDGIKPIDPPNCLAVSAKRYVLFNRGPDGEPIIRKASGHGLGHLLDPYNDPPKERREWTKNIGVPRWQADVWKEIIHAADAGKPDQVMYDALTNFNAPAASRYAATTLKLLEWFEGYNGTGKGATPKPYVKQVKPLNFLLSLQAKSRLDMAKTNMAALRDPLWSRREPRPAAPYSDSERQTFENVFDRDISQFTRIPASWLKSYARSLVRYHLHQEAKFWGASYDQLGTLRRRHVYALTFQSIGKEADNIEEREVIGDDEDDIVEYAFARRDQSRLETFVKSTQRQFKISNRVLSQHAHVSHHTIDALHAGKHLSDASLHSLAQAAEAIRQERITSEKAGIDCVAMLARKKVELGGSDAALAKFLGVSRPYATRLLNNERPIAERMMRRLMK